MSDFDRDADAYVLGALNPGEKLLWTGHCLSRIGKQRGAQSQSTWMWVIAIALCVVGVFVTTYAIFGPEKIELIGGAAFLLGGVWLAQRIVDGRFRDNQMYCRKQTVNVLTNQRAFVLKHCATDVPMRSVDWRYVEDVRAEGVGTDGRGTVKFRRWDPVTQRWSLVLQFYRVGNAERVAEWGQAAMGKAHG